MTSHERSPPKGGAPKRAGGSTSIADWYNSNATRLADVYERLSFDELHSEFIRHLPDTPCLILDIGSGTGRDAAAMAKLGHCVVAVEPSSEMRTQAQARHKHAGISWVSDKLPKLRRVIQRGDRYDAIVMSAVWMHVAESERKSAFRRIVNMLKPGGLLYITLRHGPFEPVRGFWDIPDSEVVTLAKDHGLFQVDQFNRDDAQGRANVNWTCFILRSPGDGTGALPLLRGIILNDSKSSTYKLGLLKVLQHIAQSASGLANIEDDDTVVLPLGLFALYWLRVYRPLLDQNLPQMPGNTAGSKGLGFAKKPYGHLSHISPFDLGIGKIFSAAIASRLHSALNDVCNTLVKMPMHYTTYSDGQQKVFKARKFEYSRMSEQICLDEPYLYSFGEVRISLDLWQAALQYGAWIEPAIVAEWKSLIKGYSKSQAKVPAAIETMDAALAWQHDEHATHESRKRAIELIESGTFQNCVWSHRKIKSDSFDIDHCFPFSAWPCNDMWNLMPSHSAVNRNQKREKLPKVELLQRSEDLILTWWEKAYVKMSDKCKQDFFTQASASLRMVTSSTDNLEEVFSSLVFQQRRLRINQQIAEWEGVSC